MLSKETQGGDYMTDLHDVILPEAEREELKEFISTILLLPHEDRAVLLSNANALKVRGDIERARRKRSLQEV